MKWSQCYPCLAGTVVAFWCFTQEVAGSNNLFKYMESGKSKEVASSNAFNEIYFSH